MGKSSSPAHSAKTVIKKPAAMGKSSSPAHSAHVESVLRGMEVAVSWMTRCIAAKPVPAGCYGLRVRPGRDWDWGDQNDGGWGLTIPPDAGERREWIRQTLLGEGGEPCVGSDGVEERHTLGGWWPTRSINVVWQNGEVYSYKAGDGGRYDLEFLCDSNVDSFSRERFVQVLEAFNAEMPDSHRHGRANDHVNECERRHADPLLLRMMEGESLVSVLRDL